MTVSGPANEGRAKTRKRRPPRQPNSAGERSRSSVCACVRWAGCVERCAKLLAPRAVRGIAKMVEDADELDDEEDESKFPARPLPAPTGERYRKVVGRGAATDTGYDSDADEGYREDLTGAVRRTEAENRVRALQRLPTLLTEPEATAVTEASALEASEALDRALYGAPHLGGRMYFHPRDGNVLVDVQITPDELLLLVQSEPVVRAQHAHRDDKAFRAPGGVRRYGTHYVLLRVLDVINTPRDFNLIFGAVAQALTREVASSAVPALRELLLALASHVESIRISVANGRFDVSPTTLLRDDRRLITLTFRVHVSNFHDEGTHGEGPTPELLAALDKAAERRLTALLPALAAAAPSMGARVVALRGCSARA